VTDDSEGPWNFRDPSTTTHPDHPMMDDVSAVILDDAVVRLTLLRSPLSLGDALAELHAMVSLLAQLHASLPATIAAAHDQDHTWQDIARQLQIAPATARRRYRESRTSETADSDVIRIGHDEESPHHGRHRTTPGLSPPLGHC
jgi:hypothetical protein